jgi:hypothetical protein
MPSACFDDYSYLCKDFQCKAIHFSYLGHTMSSLLKYLLVLVVLALQSCGGLSSGFLSAAPIDNASCSIYKITTEGTQGDELAFNDSDKGVVTFINVGYSGRALIQCSAGGTYTDEATG